MITIYEEKRYELKSGKRVYVSYFYNYYNGFHSFGKLIHINDNLYDIYDYYHGKKIHIERTFSDRFDERKILVDEFHS